MFGFLDMYGTYESRKVARDEFGDCMVSTAEVTDSNQPYETAVLHPDYNDGKLIIVEQYDTREEAEEGHYLWVAVMHNPPEELRDVSSAEIAEMVDYASENNDWRTHKRKR